MSRITLNETMFEVFSKMAEGNPGALTVLVDMYKQGAEIDPDAAFGELAAILALDSHEIYGPRIWMLYKDVCGTSLKKTIGVLRSVQLGYLSEQKLSHAIDHYGEGLDLDAALACVRERLPAFKM